jgi:anti-sigma B factor antagonist
MKINTEDSVINISDVKELSAANSNSFRDEVRAALPSHPKRINIDLSQTRFVDSCGLGALIALYKTARTQNEEITIALHNPTPPVQQIFELTRMHHIFEIIKN